MKISKIQKLNSGKYKIKLDTMDEIITYDDVILKENLLNNKVIDEEKLKRIDEESLFYKGYNKVLKYITRRVRSEIEIDEYIKKQELEQFKDRIKEKLKSINLINDDAYLKSYVYDRVNLSSDGPYKIIRELTSQNIDEGTSLEEVMKYEEDFNTKLEKLIKKKISCNKNSSKNILKQKLILYFSDLGYERDKIIFYFEENYVENESIIQKEYDKLYRKYSLKYKDEELQYIINNKLYSKGFKKEDLIKIIRK